MASFDWLLWNQILLFEKLSGGDTWRRICRGRSESVRGGASPGGGQLQERWSGLPLVIFFRERDVFPLERGLQRFFFREAGAFVWLFWVERGGCRDFFGGRSFCLVILGDREIFSAERRGLLQGGWEIFLGREVLLRGGGHWRVFELWRIPLQGKGEFIFLMRRGRFEATGEREKLAGSRDFGEWETSDRSGFRRDILRAV